VTAAAAAVIARLTRLGQTVATAESLTGGLIGTLLTDVPGASVAYRGGLIVYATELKAELAGVPAEILDRDGAVAASTAGELARGAARRCGATWGISTTGVAGPDRQEGQPVGTVFVGLARADEVVEVRRLSLDGRRSEIRDQSAQQALTLLLDHLLDPAH